MTVSTTNIKLKGGSFALPWQPIWKQRGFTPVTQYSNTPSFLPSFRMWTEQNYEFA